MGNARTVCDVRLVRARADTQRSGAAQRCRLTHTAIGAPRVPPPLMPCGVDLRRVHVAARMLATRTSKAAIDALIPAALKVVAAAKQVAAAADPRCVYSVCSVCVCVCVCVCVSCVCAHILLSWGRLRRDPCANCDAVLPSHGLWWFGHVLLRVCGHVHVLPCLVAVAGWCVCGVSVRVCACVFSACFLRVHACVISARP